jgi:hypothetical protein
MDEPQYSRERSHIEAKHQHNSKKECRSDSLGGDSFTQLIILKRKTSELILEAFRTIFTGQTTAK